MFEKLKKIFGALFTPRKKVSAVSSRKKAVRSTSSVTQKRKPSNSRTKLSGRAKTKRVTNTPSAKKKTARSRTETSSKPIVKKKITTKKVVPAAKKKVTAKRPDKKRVQSADRKVTKKTGKKIVKKTVSVKKAAQRKSKETNEVLIGEITHYFSRIQVVVLKMTFGRIGIGDQILVKGKKTFFKQPVKSLQVESIDVKSAQKGQLVGLQVDKKVEVGDHVYKI